MSDLRVTVAIPVGPRPTDQQWLEECLESVRQQTMPPDEILLVDDMANLPPHDGCRIWRAPWRVGVACAFNFCVALAKNELVFMLSDDDILYPTCLERCLATYERVGRIDGFYWAGVRYSDDREDQFFPFNGAMTTKGFWRMTGGFPPESGSGAPDAAFLSILMVNGMFDRVQCIDTKEPQYWYRVHENTDTGARGPWQGVILETRHLLTHSWKPPEWGRYDT